MRFVTRALLANITTFYLLYWREQESLLHRAIHGSNWVSFTGHLCGILVGLLHLYGMLDLILVKDIYLQEMEQWSMLRFLTAKENFVPTPLTSSGESNLRRDTTTLVRAVRRGCQGASSLLCRGRERL
jgi:hypothetical protein